ncbi:unnamed protein product [Meganyctiphanes norvegica]|uniref:Mitochondrial import inner membrane translocase subunit Tim21 n=1 Tax=Meganyctiphanes norvegica TaxID=48144 RepID=A0AAV2PNZ1_MEGNR
MEILILRMNLHQRCIASRLKDYNIPSFKSFSTSLNFLQQRKAALSKHVSDRSQTFGHKAKEATRTTWYTGVVLAGIGVTGLMMYSVFKELLSSFSPQKIYDVAVKKCINHPRVIDFLGDSIQSYGEESRRGRRQHISHFPYELDGHKGMRVKFHLAGQRRTATAHLDARENDSGWEFRYIYVQIDGYPYETIVVEDNRSSERETQFSVPTELTGSVNL